MTTLESARNTFFEDARTKQGGRCPCCGRFGKIYPRTINLAMAKSLAWLFQETVKAGFGEYIHVGDLAPRYVVKNGGSLASCRWWGLVEPKINEDTQKRTSGMWRLTADGIAFMRGELLVDRVILTYDADRIGTAEGGEKISIHDALRRPFDYQLLMNNQG